MAEETGHRLDRRAVLRGLAGGSIASLAGCSVFDRADDAEVTEVDDDRAKSLAEQFAPTVYFDRYEKWFPTDPRRYESERDSETVVDGFDALNGYVKDGGSDDPPGVTVFYHVVEYENSPLAVVQFWFYSVFDQFTTNFHWHDWELLQVFVDTETEKPQLYVASAHSRKAPNNEFLDPDPERQPRILTELGSHSSGLSVNENETRFQRLPLEDDVADITNSVVDGIQDIAAIPLAYGLPRDEGAVLPFAVPELDGEPVYDHPDLPAVGAENLVDEAVTIRSFDELRSPPTDLPARETGYHFEYEGRAAEDTDVTYELVPSAELEHIDDFVGPQLSFEFAIPDFAEDRIAKHITTAGVPWDSPRYENPASDISTTNHRQALANRYEAIGDPSKANQVVAAVANTVASKEAPENEGLTTESSPLELFALLESDPEAVPTFKGIAALQNVAEGDHTLTINGAGVAPHSETVSVTDDDGPTAAGVEGHIPVVPREAATKLELDPRETDRELAALAVEDDFAGRLYDAPLDGPDAVYVHEAGAFTSEVRDTDGEIGAYRTNPGDEDRIRIENPSTGKVPLATYLVDIAEETRAEVAAVADDQESGDSDDENGTGGGNSGGGGQENALNGLVRALEAVVEAARRAAEKAQDGDRGNADKQLQAVQTRLETVESRLADARGPLPEELGNAADRRLDQANRRAKQAKEAEKL